MALEIVSVVLTGVGVLLGVWRIQAHYEVRNEAAHADLARKIDGGLDSLGVALAKVAADVAKVAADVAYLRGRQDERDRMTD